MPTVRFRRVSTRAGIRVLSASTVAFAVASVSLFASAPVASAAKSGSPRAKSQSTASAAPSTRKQSTPSVATPNLQALVSAAKSQIGVTTIYDPSYVKLAYPGGDVSPERGVCTDVVIRAYRAIGVDLQVLVHQDMARNFSLYPRTGLRAPDKNIDHRRVKNLSVFYARQGASVPVSQNASDYRPGDIVNWDLSGLAHTGLVSDVLVPGTDRYQIVHNVGAGTQLEDVLFAYPITGHFRYLPGASASMAA